MYYEKIAGAVRWIKQRPFLFFAVLHAVLFMTVFAVFDFNVGGNGLERSFANLILDGQVPYRDFVSEYPPLALLSFLLPALFFRNQPAYGFTYAFEMYLCNLVILYILWKLAERYHLGVWRTMGIYTVCIAAMNTLVTGRFDILPAMLVLASLYAFIRGKNKTAWVVLALGAMTKLYPLIIAPLFALFLLQQRRYRQLALGLAVFAGVLLLLNLPWVIISPDGYIDFSNLSNPDSFLGYHMERGLHSESSYGSILLVGQMMDWVRLEAALAYGSWNIISPAADTMAGYSFFITAALLIFLYASYIQGMLKKPFGMGEDGVMDGEAAQSLLRYSILAVFIMLLASKVLSPQFLVWLCPLIPLVIMRWRYLPLIVFVFIAIATQYIYPHNYLQFELFEKWPVSMLIVRNILLLIMALWYLLPLRQERAAFERVEGDGRVTV